MMTMSDPKAAIERAKKADPGNPFVASCERFFAARGYLSDKQIASLGKVTRTLSKGEAAYHRVNWGDGGNVMNPSFYDRDDYGLSNSWDWAGGD